jgi:tripartite-type tricarboxylate transporter receptor subunit TctC
MKRERHPSSRIMRSDISRKRCARAATVLTCLTLTIALPASAQTDKPFAPRNVQLIIGFGPGGNYDLWARTLSRHLGRHLPSRPTVVPQYMPGAGSYVAAGHMVTVARRDGSVIAMISRDAVLGPLTGTVGKLFDPRTLSWIGSPATETNVCIAYRTAQVKTAQDLFTKPLTMAATGAGTGTNTYPKVLGALLGMKFRVVGGYSSSAEAFLAMERGEVEGFCESLDSIRNRRPDWIPGGTVRLLFQGGAAPHADLKDVPFIPDLARTSEERAIIEFLYAGQGIGRPFIAPPDLPPDRLKLLRGAFDATMTDPDFVAEATKNGLAVEPVSGAQLAALVDKIYGTPKAIIDKVSAMMK